MILRKKNKQPVRPGASMVEFAVVAPIVFLLLFVVSLALGLFRRS